LKRQVSTIVLAKARWQMSEIAANRVADYIDRVGRLAPLIRAHAAESEARAQLSPAVAEAFHEAGLFRMLLPSRMNGGDLTMPESLRVFEAAAAVEGSVGWNLAICAGGPIFGHFIARHAFEEIFADPRAVIAGSLNAATTQAFPCEAAIASRARPPTRAVPRRRAG